MTVSAAPTLRCPECDVGVRWPDDLAAQHVWRSLEEPVARMLADHIETHFPTLQVRVWKGAVSWDWHVQARGGTDSPACKAAFLKRWAAFCHAGQTA